MPHIHEKVDFTVEVFIVHGNKVLLRKHDKHKIWLSVGGHIELDENPNEAALREVKEEVGLEVKLAGEACQFHDNTRALLPPRFINQHKINDIHEHVTLVYFAVATSDHTYQGETEVSDEIRWFTREELHDPMHGIRENVKYYAEEALRELGR